MEQVVHQVEPDGAPYDPDQEFLDQLMEKDAQKEQQTLALPKAEVIRQTNERWQQRPSPIVLVVTEILDFSVRRVINTDNIKEEREGDIFALFRITIRIVSGEKLVIRGRCTNPHRSNSFEGRINFFRSQLPRKLWTRQLQEDLQTLYLLFEDVGFGAFRWNEHPD